MALDYSETLPLLESREETQPKKRSTLWTVCPFILGNEFCERLAYYGLATNLVTYISQVMGGEPADAAIQVSLFEGTAYITPLLGAVLADARWGRYKTILVFSIIYLLGMVLLTLSSSLPGLTPAAGATASTLQSLFLYSSLSVIALGTGGIKPCVSAFGADQFNTADPQDKREKESFFNYFYLAINVGSLIACTVIVYIQDSVSWSLGFGIPGVAMLLAILLFVAGRNVYKHVPPTESPIQRVFKVVFAALKNRTLCNTWLTACRWKKRKGSADMQAQVEDFGSLHGGQNFRPTTASQGTHRGLNSPQLLPDEGLLNSRQYDSRLQIPIHATSSYRWLEDAITEWQTSQGQLMHVGGLAGYTPKQVEEVKLVLRLLPVFFTTMMYWCVYTQMGSMFVQQGTLMRREVAVGGQHLDIPSASMSLFNTLSIILLIPVYDKLLEPAIQRCGRKITLLQRIGWGMVLAVVAMVAAAGVEAWRLHLLGSCPTESAQHSSCQLSILWQAPQYFLIGASEVLTSIGQLEFFYDQAPDVMRSCSMAMQLVSTGIGSYLSGALTWLVQVGSQPATGQQWLPRDLNKGRLDLFFLFLAALQLLDVLVYLPIAMRYEYKAVEHKGTVPPPTPQPRAAGSQPSRLGRPTLLPTSAVAIRAPQVRRGQVGYEEGQVEETPEMYGRSLAYIPPSPALPAPFR